jgi:argininosuccinate synthase
MADKIDANKVWAKVEASPAPEVNKACVAFSGGLDSSLGIELLRRKYMAKEIVAINVDVGQGAQEQAECAEKAKILKLEPVYLDAKKEFVDEWLTKAIRANSDYFGYPVSTSMTRQLIARVVGTRAAELGCDAILEGSTGKGNDQYRMHNVFSMFAPGVKVLAFVRDFDLTRGEESALCEAWGVPVTEQITGGDDKTMWCRSIASGAIGLDQEIPESIWQWYIPPEKAKDEPEDVTVEFAEGLPVKLNGNAMALDALIAELNIIAGRNGIGYIDMWEDGIMSLKSREIYEAPAAHVILKLHRDCEGSCLTKEERMFKAEVDKTWAYMTYHGEWFHPLHAALDAFIAETQKVVSGLFTVKLYKGNISIVKRQLGAGSLFAPEIRDIKARGFDQRWSANAAKIRGLPFEILAIRGRKLGGM